MNEAWRLAAVINGGLPSWRDDSGKVVAVRSRLTNRASDWLRGHARFFAKSSGGARGFVSNNHGTTGLTRGRMTAFALDDVVIELPS